jgi:hypothetical protein
VTNYGDSNTQYDFWPGVRHVSRTLTVRGAPSLAMKHDAPALGSAAMVADQDADNLCRIQKGLKTSRKPGVTLERYQESRIQHFNAPLDAYLAR